MIIEAYENEFNKALAAVPRNSLPQADQRTQREMYAAEELLAVHSKFITAQLEYKDYQAFLDRQLDKKVKELMEGVLGSLAGLEDSPNRERKPNADPMPVPAANNPFRQQLQQPTRDNRQPSGGHGLHIPDNISPINSGIQQSAGTNDRAVKELEGQLRMASAALEDLKSVNQTQKKIIDELKQDKKKLERDLEKERGLNEKLIKDTKKDNLQLEDIVKGLQDRVRQQDEEIQELNRDNNRLYEDLKSAHSNRGGALQPPSEEPGLREKVRALSDKLSKLESENQSQREGSLG